MGQTLHTLSETGNYAIQEIFLQYVEETIKHPTRHFLEDDLVKSRPNIGFHKYDDYSDDKSC